MQVSPNVKVAPTTAHILSHLKDRREAKEMAMSAADASTHLIKMLELYAQACRKYAGAPDQGAEFCSSVLEVKEASKYLSPLATMLAAMGGELCVLHHVHHEHGNPELFGQTLDANIEFFAGLIQEAQWVQQISREEAFPSQQGGMSFADLLSAILRGK